jgi:Rap1a immunity proteins
MMDATTALGTAETTGVRMAEGVTSGQTTRVVERWLRNHPEQLHKHAGTLVVQILRETWPAK